MNASCIEKNTLSCSSFTCINMSHNTNIACLFQGELSCHVFFSFLIIYFIFLLVVVELPTIVSKGFVCFCHFMYFFTSFYCCSSFVLCIQVFIHVSCLY